MYISLIKHTQMKLTKPVPCVSRRTGNFCTSALQIEVYSSEVGCVVVCHMPREVIVIISVLIVFVMTPSDNACVTLWRIDQVVCTFYLILPFGIHFYSHWKHGPTQNPT